MKAAHSQSLIQSVVLQRNSFDLKVKCKDANMIICGVRVELGKQSIDKSATYIQVFGRRKPVINSVSRSASLMLDGDFSMKLKPLTKFLIKTTCPLENGNTLF